MKKKVIVLSLGGSLIVPDKIDVKFLEKFKKVLLKNTSKYKFVVACGGGSTARIYIKGLEKQQIKKKKFFQSLVGISSTRLNARFMTYFIGKDANKGIPHDMKQIQGMLRRNPIVFCGALRYAKDETSDGTSAKLAHYFKTDFINMTNIKGLHNKDPKKFKNAKFIKEITWQEFSKLANKSKFKPGQHFVLDQSAAKIIEKHKIITYIIGKDLKQLDNLLKGKKFTGTTISG
jgi:uridylate kinase